MPADLAPLLLVVAASAVILGTVLQRVSGMGVGLVVSPTLALLLGPVSGVLLTNIATIISAALIGFTLRRDIDWQRYRRLAPLIVVGSVPGALLVGAADRAWLEVIIGVALLGTLLTTALVTIPPLSGRLPAAVAGTAGGFLNTAVGVAAPAMLVYAQATGWQQRSFAATLQPIFGTMGLVSVLVKVGLGAAPLAALPLSAVAVVVALVPVGIVIGGLVARRVPAAVGRRVAVLVVTAGALSLLGRGVGGLAGII
ncbi:sulfite exporter TauE/SafE family protein [Dietzia sp. Die43]|uniref:sulfite exporter TauE/SafE family protein n=1 Tax=Dietzia sp. Die43 TaxID=2926011 RepID=UPI002117A89B|nr:sulfite exporter TauE/SafE family protein [Dietzia sp. Die43]